MDGGSSIMKRPAVVVVALAVALAVGLAQREPRSDAAPPSPRVRAAPRTAAADLLLPDLVPPPERSLFAFAAGAPSPRKTAPGAPPVPQWVDRPAVGPALPRLVGFVRRTGRSLAVLAWNDEVLVLGAGQTQAGVTVESIDDETSVRLRIDDGRELQLLAEG